MQAGSLAGTHASLRAAPNLLRGDSARSLRGGIHPGSAGGWLLSQCTLPPSTAHRLPSSPGRQTSACGTPRSPPALPDDGPICRALVLEHREGRLDIPVPPLEAARAGGEFPILGPLGNTWGRGSTRGVPGCRMLELLKAQDGAAAVVAAIAETPNGQELEVLSIVNGTEKRRYAGLVQRQDGAFECRSSTQEVLAVFRGDPVELQLTAEGRAEKPLASGRRGSARRTGFGSLEHFELWMQPGVDTALLVLCMLGLVIFRG